MVIFELTSMTIGRFRQILSKESIKNENTKQKDSFSTTIERLQDQINNLKWVLNREHSMWTIVFIELLLILYFIMGLSLNLILVSF